MRQTKANSGFFEFLKRTDKLGVSQEEYVLLRKQYRREYEKLYKRTRRQVNKHYVISFNPAEVAEIRKAATNHGIKREAIFLKQAGQAYIRNVYLVPDKSVLDRVLQILLKYQSAIEEAKSRDSKAWYKPDRSYAKLDQSVREMRDEMLAVFKRPPSLLDAIRIAIKEQPNFIEELKQIISDHAP